MTVPRWIRWFWMHTFATNEREHDEDFRETISGHASRGMIVVGILGIMSVLVNLGANAIYGKEVVWTPGDPRDTILIWDKLVLLGLSLSLIAISGRNIPIGWKRAVAAIMAIAASNAILLEDYLQGSVFVSEQYIGLLVFVVIVAIPFKPWHAMILVPFVVGSYIVICSILQDHPRIVVDGFAPGVIVFTIIIVFLAIGLNFLLYNARYEQHRIRKKSERLSESLRHSLDELNKAQDKLVHAQRMASLGNLSAGIAHELSNPLNFVNNFASLSTQLVDEVKDILDRSRSEPGKYGAELDELMEGLRGNIERIDKHGKRATDIVKNMINHTNLATSEVQELTVSKLVDDNIGPALNSIALGSPSFRPDIVRDYDATLLVNGVPTELGRVFWNLLRNAFYEVNEKARLSPSTFKPTVMISVRKSGDNVKVTVRDNGRGIDPDVEKNIFDPFVTTKPPGAGTGLGLSMTYEIVVQGHGGSIEVENYPGEGATFIVSLPMTGSQSSSEAPLIYQSDS